MAERSRRFTEVGEKPVGSMVEKIFASVDEFVKTTKYPAEYLHLPGELQHDGGLKYDTIITPAITNPEGKPTVLLTYIFLAERLTQTWVATATWEGNKPVAGGSRLIPAAPGENEFDEAEVAISGMDLTDRLVDFIRKGGVPRMAVTLPQGQGQPAILTSVGEQGTKPN